MWRPRSPSTSRGETLELRLTNNHYSMNLRAPKIGWLPARLHRMFVAPSRGGAALARYVVHNDRRRVVAARRIHRENQHIIRRQTRRPRHFNIRTPAATTTYRRFYNR